jgi:hypothetical protein
VERHPRRLTCPWHGGSLRALLVPSRLTMECHRRRPTCPWHGGSLRALLVPSRRTMERHRRRPTYMPVAALTVAVATRFALIRLKVSSVKSGTSSSSHISSTCKQNGDFVFKWKCCLKNLEYISNNENRKHTCQ